MSGKLCPFCMRITTEAACTYCGKPTDYAGRAGHLPVGFVVHGKHPYVLGAALGQGGFGITYIALDMDSCERVAIKEYFPTFCAGRVDTSHVAPYQNQDEVYEKGKTRFLDEARLLKSLSDLKSVVNVLDFFEFNNSAYLVMEFLDGPSLKQQAAEKGKFPAKKFLRQIYPLMEDIEKMHQRGVIHRDIAPDNIILLPDGQLKLIDFGAARSFVGDKSMTVVVKKGFAPLEQYYSKGACAGTDVYALAATIYYCITGKVPTDSAEREGENKPLLSPTSLGADLTPEQEVALTKALEVHLKNRFQSVQAFLTALKSASAAKPAPSNPPPVKKAPPKPDPAPQPSAPPRPAPSYTPQSPSYTPPSPSYTPPSSSRTSSAPKPTRRRRRGGCLPVLLVIAGLAVLLFRCSDLRLDTLKDNYQHRDTSYTEYDEDPTEPPLENAVLAYGMPQQFTLDENGLLQTLTLYDMDSGKYTARVEFVFGENSRIETITCYVPDELKIQEQQYAYEDGILSYEIFNPNTSNKKIPMRNDDTVTLLFYESTVPSPLKISAYYPADGNYMLYLQSNTKTYFTLFFNEHGQLAFVGTQSQNDLHHWYNPDMTPGYKIRHAYEYQTYKGDITYFQKPDGKISSVAVYGSDGNPIPAEQFQLMNENDQIIVHGATERILQICLPGNVSTRRISGISVQLSCGSENIPPISIPSNELFVTDSGDVYLYLALPADVHTSIFKVTSGTVTINYKNQDPYTVSWYNNG